MWNSPVTLPTIDNYPLFYIYIYIYIYLSLRSSGLFGPLELG